MNGTPSAPDADSQTARDPGNDFAEMLDEARPGRPLWTPLLIAVNVLVFAALIMSGERVAVPDVATYIEWGANYGPAIHAGEFWRLISAAFLHFGPLHLFLNMSALWDAGRLVERCYGRGPFLLIYVGSAALASAASVAWYGDAVVSAGASGAVFGIYGALAAFFIVHMDAVPAEVLKRWAKSTLVFLGLLLYLGFTQPEIDNAAHLGGLVAGFLLALPLSKPLEHSARLSPGRAAGALAMAAGALLLFVPALPAWNYDWREEIPARRALDRFSAEDQQLNELADSIWHTVSQRTSVASRVETEVLPAWRAVLADLQGTEAPPGSRIADRLRIATRYAAMRVDMYATWLEGVLEKDQHKVKRSHQTGDALREVMYDYERTFERDYMVAADRARSAPAAPEKGRD